MSTSANVTVAVLNDNFVSSLSMSPGLVQFQGLYTSAGTHPCLDLIASVCSARMSVLKLGQNSNNYNKYVDPLVRHIIHCLIVHTCFQDRRDLFHASAQ
jgi:hypothetical protein